MTVAAVVLAAGRSTRAGRTNKLTAPIGGTPMVARVVEAVLGSPARPVIVVTGHEAPALRASLAGRDVTFVHNPDFADGMATSIRAGVAALPEEASAVVVCLGDMPALSSGDIARLVAAFESGGADICVPVTAERRGNPALFARRFFSELQALSGDTGARGLIAAHPDRVREVAVEGAGILTDLDTEADIDAYNRTQNQ
ncbi:MAG: NTP transferase domain-containing protein [Alphaproteobacteria bacterium]|jgi:molybdenum cofactor cytidylyltransferase|nr:NTP transferase domain-containing protein [Alphaproteobacteria bacterium]